MAQFARPASDISTGNWTTAPLYSSIDETPYSDSDYVTSAKNAVNDTFEVALSPVSDPGSSDGHVLRIRVRASKANGSTSFSLYQGAALVASGITGTHALTFATFEYTLSASEADLITDYSDLRLRVVSSVSSNGYAYCSWAELEVPDAAVYDDLSAQNIATAAPMVEPSVITQVHSLTASEVTSTPLVNQAVLEQVHALSTLNTLFGVPFAEIPTLKQVYGLSTLSVATHIPAVTQATIGQDHLLQGNPIESGVPVLGLSALAQGHALTGQTIESAVPVLGQASLLTPVDLAATDILSVPVLTSPSISQHQVLESLSLTSSSPVVAATAIAEIHNLRISSIVADFPASESPALGPHHLLAKDIAATPGVQMASMDALYSRAGDYILSAQYLGVAGTPLLYFPLVANPPDELSATDVQPGVPVVEKASLVAIVALQGVEIVSAVPLSEQPALGQEQRLTGQPFLAGVPIIETANLEILAHSLTAQDLEAGTGVIEAAAIGQVHQLDFAGIASGTPTLAEPELSESVFALTATQVAAGNPVVGEAVLAESIVALEARDIQTGLPTLEKPAFLQSQTLGAYDLLINFPAIETTTLGQEHDLAVDGIFSEPSVESPTFTENVDQLIPSDISTGAASIEPPVVQQTHELASLDTVTGAVTIQPPTITQAIHALTPTDLPLGVPVVTPTAISQAHALSAFNITSVPQCGEPTLSQEHALEGSDVEFSFSVEEPALYQVHGLLGASISTNEVFVEPPSLVGVVGFNAADLVADAPLVEQGALLLISHFGAVDIASGVPEIEQISMEVILGNPWYYYAQL